MLFDQSILNGRTRRPWTLLVSFAGQCLGVCGMVLIPLVATDTLPAARLARILSAPVPPPPPPPRAVRVVGVVREKAVPRQFELGKLFTPTAIPPKVNVIVEEAPSFSTNDGPWVVGGVPGGSDRGVWGGVPNILRDESVTAPAAPPPAVKEAAKPAVPTRIRVGGNVQQAKLISQARPVYPPLAKSARIQGVVRLSAIIGRDGAIDSLQVVGGHPLLVPAALEAVRSWRYQPTLLNGEAVEVLTQIDIHFTLQ